MTEFVIRSVRPEPVARLLNPAAAVRSVVRHSELLRQFARRDLMQQYKGTSLGLVWAGVRPLLILAVYTFLFGFVLKIRWEQEGPLANVSYGGAFALQLFTGWLVFMMFSECVTRAPGLVTSRPNFVRKVVFPLHILPLVTVSSALARLGIGMLILLVAAIVSTGHISKTLWLLPVVLVPLIFLSLGAAYFLASLGVFVRDITHVVQVLVQLLFFLTPVFYPFERLLNAVPPEWRWAPHLNPLAVIVEETRAVVLMGEWPNWMALGIVTAVSFVVMQVGYAWFQKSRKGFADVL